MSISRRWLRLPVFRHIGLLPGAHAPIDQEHLTMHMFGGIADKTYLSSAVQRETNAAISRMSSLGKVHCVSFQLLVERSRLIFVHGVEHH